MSYPTLHYQVQYNFGRPSQEHSLEIRVLDGGLLTPFLGSTPPWWALMLALALLCIAVILPSYR